MRPRILDLSLHVLRLVGAAALLAVSGAFAGAASVAFAVGGAASLFLASFALAHDALHGALKLPRRVNAVVLSLAGVLMFFSGHAMRRGHLRHHARPLAADDVEGAPARGSFLGSLLRGPVDAMHLRAASWRLAPRSERKVIAVEWVVSAMAWGALLLVPSQAVRIYAVVGAVLQLWMGAWAAWIPHNAPGWLRAAARKLARSRSAALLSLAYHDEHHEAPWIPCARLGSR